MQYDPEEHHRRSVRLKGYDYSRAGAYFVTVCTRNRECLFGDVTDGIMRLNKVGRVVEKCWQAIPSHFSTVRLDAFVIMPNHVHGIITIVGPTHTGATHASPLRGRSRPSGPGRQSIGAIIGSFKSAVTRRINQLRGTPGGRLWQRNYYEHIIRNSESLDRIREYIVNNPLQWELDRENPNVDAGVNPPSTGKEPWCV